MRTKIAALAILTGVAAALIIAGACGSDDPAPAAPTPQESADTPATLTNEDGWPRVEGLRGQRYCEVLLLELIDGSLIAEVWNTLGLNECPDDAWAALDAEAIQAERGVFSALLNGPRYWLMDAIEMNPPDEVPMTTFGALDMFLAATVDIGPPPPDLTTYMERRVARDTVFEFSAGAQIFELMSPDGKVYVMQSYSVQNAALTEAELPQLAARITPPDGWAYRSRVLDEVLRVRTMDAQAVVIQDELANTYQLIQTE